MTRQACAALLAVALMWVVTPPSLIQAQTEGGERRTVAPYYDATKEITIHATVSSVVTKASPEMILGSHLLLKTSRGVVDASLGVFGLKGKGAFSVAVGDEVEVTGVMKTLKGQEVFLVRTAKAGGQVYTIRNEHGIALSPQARERASQKTAQNREGL